MYVYIYIYTYIRICIVPIHLFSAHFFSDLTDTHARKRPRASYLPPQSARADYTNLRSRLTNRSNRSLDNTRERSLWPRSDPPNNSHETPLPFPPVPPLLVPHDLSLLSSPALSFLPLLPLPPALLFSLSALHGLCSTSTFLRSLFLSLVRERDASVSTSAQSRV